MDGSFSLIAGHLVIWELLPVQPNWKDGIAPPDNPMNGFGFDNET